MALMTMVVMVDGGVILTVHGNAADDVLSEMLGNLQHQLVAILVGRQGVKNGRELLSIEFL